jgi:salicylate 5-hydroxylase large subunit
MISERGNAGGKGEVTQGVTSFKESMKLHDDRFLDVVPEPWWNGPTVVMMTLFPSVIVQQQVNSFPRATSSRAAGRVRLRLDAFRLRGRHPEMTRRRLRQANLFGPPASCRPTTAR